MSELERNVLMTQLYEEYYDRLSLFCHRMIGFRPELIPIAEECVQDVFHTALKKYMELIDHPDVEGWLFRCSINHMNNALKTYYGRKKKHAYSADDSDVAELFDPHDSFRALEEKQDLADTLDRIYKLLIEGEKDIFDQYFLEGHDLEQVAKRVGKSESSVKSTIYRLRKRLKKSFLKNLIIFLLIGASFHFLNK